MQWNWNYAKWNPWILKILGGLAGGAVLLVFVFEQPWIPVEITRAETGVLVALAAPSLENSPAEVKSSHPAEKVPIEVSLANAPDEQFASAERFVQTAEVPPPLEAKIPAPSPSPAAPAELPIDVADAGANSWQLGKPTVAYQLPEPFEVPASAKGPTWNFVIPTGVKRELFLTGVELRPGNRTLVKRMTLSFDPTGAARMKDEETPTPGFASPDTAGILPALILGEWTPGRSASPLPTDAAYRIPAGADLVLTVEYAAAKIAASDPWSMGLHISRKPAKHLLGRIEVSVPGEPKRMSKADLVRAHANGFRQIASYRLPTDVTVFSVCPEIAGDGVGIRASAKTPDGQTIRLLHIDNWQAAGNELHRFAKPIALPQDSLILVETWIPDSENSTAGPPAAHLVLEISTLKPEHLEPLLRHNAAANAGN